jgi:lysophospholipase L1-like esterase
VPRLRFVCFCLLVLPLAVIGSTPASADSPPQPSIYLAMGDSVAFGVGAQPRTTEGYVPELYDQLTAARDCGDGEALGCRLDLVNLAEVGATTSSLLTKGGQLDKAVTLLEERNGNSTPVDDVDLITIDIGGNDLNFRELLKVCVPDTADPACVLAIQTALTQVATNYPIILSALRQAAGPDTTIAVMTYYNPLPACDLKDFAGFADLVLEGGGPVRVGLNDIIRSAAAASGAVVAETAPVIDVEDLVGGTDCLHPDNSGHDDIADAFAAVIDIPEVTGPPAS